MFNESTRTEFLPDRCGIGRPITTIRTADGGHVTVKGSVWGVDLSVTAPAWTNGRLTQAEMMHIMPETIRTHADAVQWWRDELATRVPTAALYRSRKWS